MDKNDAILLENVNHKLDAVLEGQQAMASMPGDLAQLKDDMVEVKSDIKTIKAVVTGHSSELQDHEARITAFEGTAG